MHLHNIRHFIVPIAQGLGVPLYVAAAMAVYQGAFQAQYEVWQAHNAILAFALWMGVAALLMGFSLTACLQAARRAPSVRRACWIVGCWLSASVMLGFQAFQESEVWLPCAGIGAMAAAYMALAVISQREEWEAWRRQYLDPLDRAVQDPLDRAV